MERQRLTTPLGDAADCALIDEQTVRKQSVFEVPPICLSPRNQQNVERDSVVAFDDTTAFDRLNPGVDREPEVPPAFGHGVTVIVKSLNLVPIVATAGTPLGCLAPVHPFCMI